MECLFCKIAAGEIPAEIIYRKNGVVAFHDILPQAPVHVLLIPEKHIATLNDLTDDDQDLMGALILGAREVATQFGLSENGYRLVMNCNKDAGQSVFHVHCHVLGGRSMHWPPG
jgi:histidine triad (HIT) family protein